MENYSLNLDIDERKKIEQIRAQINEKTQEGVLPLTLNHISNYLHEMNVEAQNLEETPKKVARSLRHDLIKILEKDFGHLPKPHEVTSVIKDTVNEVDDEIVEIIEKDISEISKAY